MGERKNIFITVKTYPHPSNTYGELVCTAGIDEAGNFIRLYPLRYRRMSGEEQFAKYQWVSVEIEKSQRDSRPESFYAAQSTLTPLAKVDSWKDRRELVLGNRALTTMCELTKETCRLNRSLAIVKPEKILDFTAEPDAPDWSPEQSEALRQKLLWDTGQVKPLKKVPYKFYYHYKCQDSNCTGHKQSVYDWELHVLCLKMLEQNQDSKIALGKVRQAFFDKICAPKFDMHFFVGTHNQYPAWMILGTFYPPHLFPPEKKGQVTLWSMLNK